MPDRTLIHAVLAANITAVLTTLLAVISWTLFEFDRALFIYAMALITSATLTTYRFTIWVHRPPTLSLYQQAWNLFRTSPRRLKLAKSIGMRAFNYFALNKFVWKRGLNRWGAHWPIMIGCVMALAIVVPLIFGWVWFETPADDLKSYKVMNFGIHLTTIPVDGIQAFLAFHGLVWASIPVICGCSVALRRRCKDRGDQAVQTFWNDIIPLAILLAIAITGLLMTFSYSFFGGVFHSPLAVAHMTIVCGTLLWLPYSKLFHIPQRTLKLASMIYQHEAASKPMVVCARCGNNFADQQQIDDLIAIQKQLGYRYQTNGVTEDYQLICPQCRRASLVLAQGQRWKAT